MEKLPFFYFKEHSSLDFGLYIKEKGSYKGAQREVTYTPVPGRDGDLMTDEGSYQNIKIPYKLELLNNSPRSFPEIARLLKQWLLLDPGYYKLWDTYDREYFRLASFTGEVNPEQKLRDYGSLDITFNCKPHKYAVSGQNTITITSSPKKIYNAEMCTSKPYLKIYGSGTLYVYINSKQFKFTDVSGYVEVDSETMECYKGSTALNNKMASDGFPELVPGENTISKTSDVTQIDIIPRWRSL